MTVVPWQTGLAEAAMETLAGRAVPAVIVIVLDSTGLVPLIQVELDVSQQVTRSPLVGEKVKDGLFVPAFDPLTFH